MIIADQIFKQGGYFPPRFLPRSGLHLLRTGLSGSISRTVYVLWVQATATETLDWLSGLRTMSAIFKKTSLHCTEYTQLSWRLVRRFRRYYAIKRNFAYCQTRKQRNAKKILAVASHQCSESRSFLTARFTKEKKKLRTDFT